MMLLYPIILSILLTVALIPVLNKLAPGLKNVDRPDNRKLHPQASMFNMFFSLRGTSLLLTVMFTRRNRFQFSPMHLVLILFIVLVVPYLHSEGTHGCHMAMLVATIIILLWDY